MIENGKRELRDLNAAVANGGRAGTQDGGRMGMYKLNQIRGLATK